MVLQRNTSCVPHEVASLLPEHLESASDVATQTAKPKSVTRKGGFFNNQTTDKCGRLITAAKDFGLLARKLSVLTRKNVMGFSDLDLYRVADKAGKTIYFLLSPRRQAT